MHSKRRTTRARFVRCHFKWFSTHLPLFQPCITKKEKLDVDNCLAALVFFMSFMKQHNKS